MSPHDDPEGRSQNVRLNFSDCHDGGVLIAARGDHLGSGFDFYLVVVVDRQTRRVMVRAVDGTEFWSPWWAFNQCITQQAAEALGARWRVAPQQRPHLVGPSRHPPKR